jgi:shikimate dehydrogenase
MPALYGIIGFPLEHSFSPAYFKKKFADQRIDAEYRAFPLKDISQLNGLLNPLAGIRGLSVTIPYKQAVIPFLDEVDDVAQQVGAVNCIAIRNGRKKGYNTDVIGFEQSLVPLLHAHHTHSLVLGTGGAAKAVTYVLAQLGIKHQSVSRDKKNGIPYNELTTDTIDHHKLIINTTPVGMYPHVDEAPPIPYDAIGPQHLLYDLIYNPEETKFLASGRAMGTAIKNGYEMLHLQAEAAWNAWTRW